MRSRRAHGGECTEKTVVAAKEHLREHFSLVGVTTRFEESVALAKVIFGWRVRHYAEDANLHVTPGRPREVRPEIRALIEEYNSFDMELLRYAVSLFDETLNQRAAEVSEALEDLRLARIRDGRRLLLYRGVSSAIRMLTLGHSAIRSIINVSRSREYAALSESRGDQQKSSKYNRCTSYRSTDAIL